MIDLTHTMYSGYSVYVLVLCAHTYAMHNDNCIDAVCVCVLFAVWCSSMSISGNNCPMISHTCDTIITVPVHYCSA